MVENTDLSELLKGHSNKWVALSADSNRVVGVAGNPKEALKQAQDNKESSPILTKTPKHYGTFILWAQRLNLTIGKFPAEPSEAFPGRFSAARPAIPITLINGDKRINYISIIDSGADLSIFHAEIGEQIDIEIEKGKQLPFFGIYGKPMTAYFHQIKIGVGGYEFNCCAGFSRELDQLPYGLLGQYGFFDLFTITFDFTKKRLELKF